MRVSLVHKGNSSAPMSLRLNGLIEDQSVFWFPAKSKISAPYTPTWPNIRLQSFIFRHHPIRSLLARRLVLQGTRAFLFSGNTKRKTIILGVGGRVPIKNDTHTHTHITHPKGLAETLVCEMLLEYASKQYVTVSN